MRSKLLLLTACFVLMFLALGHQAEAQWQPCTEGQYRSFASGTCCPEPFGRGMNTYVCQNGLWVYDSFHCEQGFCSQW